VDFAELQQAITYLQRQVLPGMQRDIRDLAATVELQRQRIVRLENHTGRRVALTLTNLVVGFTDVPIVWDTPLPGPDYTPLVTFQAGDNAITVLRWGLSPGTKDENGCVIRINNTGAVTIASVGMDVVAVRPLTCLMLPVVPPDVRVPATAGHVSRYFARNTPAFVAGARWTPPSMAGIPTGPVLTTGR